ncbi:MAG TPA: hypothetical protein DIT48_05270 [Actinobacteria bacterium]|nr:hypothetical protein [Actinomycetota bacterium]
MKGDRVEVVVDTGGGVQTYEIVAMRAGRRVEVSNARGVVEVSEVTRTGVTVRTGRFMAQRVVALVEHPASGDEDPDAIREPRRRRGAPENQQSLI